MLFVIKMNVLRMLLYTNVTLHYVPTCQYTSLKTSTREQLGNTHSYLELYVRLRELANMVSRGKVCISGFGSMSIAPPWGGC